MFHCSVLQNIFHTPENKYPLLIISPLNCSSSQLKPSLIRFSIKTFLNIFSCSAPVRGSVFILKLTFLQETEEYFSSGRKKKWFLQPLEITWKGLHESKAISLVYKMNQSKEKPSVATGMKSLIQCANILNHDSLFLHNLALPGLLLWSCWFGGSEAMGSSWELPGARAELRTLRFYFTLSHMLFFLGPKLGLKMVFKSRSWELHMKCWLCCN